MRDVDEALARVYAQQNGAAERARPGAADAVPPPPHVAPRTDANPSARTPHAAGTTPPPRSRPAPVRFSWPVLVRTLETLYGDRFERMADVLLAARARQAIQVLLFTSCHRAEGRTTLLLTLARALARRPGRVVLVDADLTSPMLARQLGVPVATGLDDVVNAGQPLPAALLESAGDNLSLLPLRQPVAHPRAFLASPAWTCALARLRREFDFVLVDGSPLFSGLSATVMHRSVDAAVLVQNHTLSSAARLERAREVLSAGGVPVLGVAETFVA